MKTFYELIEETTQFELNEIVLNSKHYQYFNYDADSSSRSAKNEKYLMRRIYMEKNILKWVDIVDTLGDHRKLLSFHHNGVFIRNTLESLSRQIVHNNEPILTEEEFFQISLVEDYICLDYDLYVKVAKFHKEVLLPIFQF